ncbi:hypothetical protein APB26_32645 [Pseudomonas aeruginosa]|uniref:hypothetical protein n=1 Tax=Pseudomonas aeruginosa TaxID=287 RepID=UPI00071BA16D|nr:hypothetical protein [Pseudomonas aeruginosa]KSQ21732.1 hypothetical protein APB26_32645 [Pseudomonas aeruginosa]RPV61405.1 hypothetical protein IPC838_18985 [Pseudomonas aeruginosa]
MAKLNPFTFPYDKTDVDHDAQKALSDAGADYVEKRSDGNEGDVEKALERLDKLIEAVPASSKELAHSLRLLLVEYWHSLPEADDVDDVGEAIRTLLTELGISK